MEFDGFDWDDGNRVKCQRHGVSIEEALSVIRCVVDNPSPIERRYRTVGCTRTGRWVFAVFTMRGRRLRPISVRYMHAKSVSAICMPRRCAPMKKPWPVLKTDEEAEAFVATADLTEYDFSELVPMTFEYTAKDSRVTMRLPSGLLAAVKARAKARGMPYQRYTRELLEREVRG